MQSKKFIDIFESISKMFNACSKKSNKLSFTCGPRVNNQMQWIIDKEADVDFENDSPKKIIRKIFSQKSLTIILTEEAVNITFCSFKFPSMSFTEFEENGQKFITEAIKNMMSDQ